MKCPECGKESEKDHVCVNCGLVFIDHPLDFRPTKSLNNYLKRKEYKNEFSYPLSPHIRYSHLSPSGSKRGTLRRAFKLQRKKRVKDKEHYYLKAYLHIKKYCALLNLSSVIVNEALNLYKNVIKKDDKFIQKCGTKPSYLAFIKIACRIHEFPLTNTKLMTLVNYKTKEKRTTAYMDRKFNKAYIMTLRLLQIRFEIPENPKYIDYVSETLQLPYSCANTVRKMFRSLRHCFRPECKIEGYILALYYIRFKHEFNLSLDILEKLFDVSRITIGTRRDEINKITRIL